MDNKDLELKLQNLQKEKDELERKYKKLQFDYSENTIIQSMNDMKKRYDNLILNTVSKYKYDLIAKKSNDQSKKICTTVVLTNHILKRLKILEQYINEGVEMDLYRIEFELLTIKEILEDEHGYQSTSILD